MTPENTPKKIVARIDDLSSRPSWLKESEPFVIEKGTVTSLGQTTIPGDNRVEAGYRVAENNAKAAIAGAIEQRLEFIFQNAEEGSGIDATQAHYIGAESSKIVTFFHSFEQTLLGKGGDDLRPGFKNNRISGFRQCHDARR